jgi:hypothetical protein
MPAVAPLFEDCNGPLLRGDPLLDPPWAPGPFVGVEFDLLAPHIKNHISGPVAITGFIPDTVQLPTATLDWVSVPRFDVGYRFAQGCGEAVLSYRYLMSYGKDLVDGFDLNGLPGYLRSRLDAHVIDLDYGGRPIPLGGCWDVQWHVGARLMTVFFDSQAVASMVEQRMSNEYIGAGPHAALDLRRELPRRGMALFGRIEGAALWGQIHQNFEEVGFLGGPPVGGATLLEGSQAVPMLNVRAGVEYAWPLFCGRLRVALGYEWERWWHVGRLGDSEAELTVQGIFFQTEYGW